jgi:ribosomal protein S18 acetylase RimI-like enzyme
VNTVVLRSAVSGDASRLAELHAQRIGEGFLASLGPVFLKRLYRRVIRSRRAFAIVADDGGQVVAFCAAAENVRRFYLEFMVRDAVAAVASSAARIIRAAPHALETLRYPATTGALPNAEILAVVTDAEASSRGLGGAVLDAALSELRRRGCDSAKVVAGASNDSALRLYRRSGFATAGSISIHDDVASEVLVWAHS